VSNFLKQYLVFAALVINLQTDVESSGTNKTPTTRCRRK